MKIAHILPPLHNFSHRISPNFGNDFVDFGRVKWFRVVRETPYSSHLGYPWVLSIVEVSEWSDKFYYQNSRFWGLLKELPKLVETLYKSCGAEVKYQRFSFQPNFFLRRSYPKSWKLDIDILICSGKTIFEGHWSTLNFTVDNPKNDAPPTPRRRWLSMKIDANFVWEADLRRYQVHQRYFPICK